VCTAFFQEWGIFPSVPHFSKSAASFQVLRIFPRVAHFSKCGAFFQEWRIFHVWRNFSKCGAFFPWQFKTFRGYFPANLKARKKINFLDRAIFSFFKLLLSCGCMRMLYVVV